MNDFFCRTSISKTFLLGLFLVEFFFLGLVMFDLFLRAPSQYFQCQVGSDFLRGYCLQREREREDGMTFLQNLGAS